MRGHPDFPEDPTKGRMADDQIPRDHYQRVADLSVLQFQVGSMQTALDRGIGALERSMDKGFDQMLGRLDGIEGRLKMVEERQAVDSGRLQALERFRQDSEERDQARISERESRYADALDGSQTARTLRLIGSLVIAAIAAIGTIVGIVAALTGAFQ